MADNFISLKPSEAVEGGAVPDNIDLTVNACRVEQFDYQGKAPATIVISLTLADDDGGTYDQKYSIGPPDRYMPSPDGKRIVGLGGNTALVKSSNAFKLLQAFINAGFPEDQVSADVSALEGVKAHFQAFLQAERQGLAGSKPKPISLPTKVIKLPGEKAGGGGSKKGAVAAKGAAELDPAAMGEGLALLAELLADRPQVSRSELAGYLFSGKIDADRANRLKGVVFLPAFQEAAAAAGYKVVKEVFSRAA